MRKINLLVGLMIAVLILWNGCSTTSPGISTLPEPESNNVMVCGDILVENINFDAGFTYWDFPLDVVIIGKDMNGDIDEYKTTTDRKGYFCFPNLPRGSYLLKAVILKKPGMTREVIINDWKESNSRFYIKKHPEEDIFYWASWFPPKSDKKIINNGIIWFGMQSARIYGMEKNKVGKLSVEKMNAGFKGKRFWSDGHIYTRQDPVKYFKQKFPESKWWD